MWVEKIPSGKYRYCERYFIEETGKTVKLSVVIDSKSNQAKKTAKELLDEKYQDKLNTIHSPTAGLKFEDISKQWLEIKQGEWKDSTYTNTKYKITAINRSIGDILIDELKTYHINSYLADEVKDKTYRTVVNYKSLITQVLEFASDNQLIEMLPYQQMIKVPKVNMKKQKQEWKYLEREELEQIYQFLSNHKRFEYLNMAKIQVATGMRFNEMIALDYVEDIDYKKQTITISKNYDVLNNIITTTKTDTTRAIAVPSEVLEVIREQIAITQRKIIKHNFDRSNRFLFINRTGKPVNIRDANRVYNNIPIEDKKISTHIFRHTFITLMAESGVDKNLIAKHVGHSSTKMIDQVYSHFTDTMDEKLRNFILQNKII